MNNKLLTPTEIKKSLNHNRTNVFNEINENNNITKELPNNLYQRILNKSSKKKKE